MKDERWFERFWLDLDDAVDDVTAILNKKRTIEIIKRIYRQGRADQNEADLDAVRDMPRWINGNDTRFVCRYDGIVAAIRAAGPEDK